MNLAFAAQASNSSAAAWISLKEASVLRWQPEMIPVTSDFGAMFSESLMRG
jgi:hypothetical protein